MNRSALLLLVAVSALSARTGFAAARDVQIVDIDFELEVVELFNFGTGNEDLSGWRFCSHDDNEIRRYSSSTGLDGVMIGPNEPLFIHFANDAPADPDHINLPAGNFALPLDRGPYALGLYFSPVVFSDGNTIADHVQWSIDGVDNTSADERSDEAEAGGVWTDQSLWAITNVDTAALTLKESAEGLVLHGPDDYAAVPEPASSLSLLAGAGLVVALPRRRGARITGTCTGT
jgi:hypothetical protein